jgi:diketogulonate reductase-like aldo/keto reductase
MNKIKLYNEISMPPFIQGLPLIKEHSTIILVMPMALNKIKFCTFENIIAVSIKNGITGFDTSHDYGKSEK